MHSVEEKQKSQECEELRTLVWLGLACTCTLLCYIWRKEFHGELAA